MIRYIKADSSRTAHGLVADVYGQMKREFGVLGEPLTLHSPSPAILAGVWCSCRESLVAGSVSRSLKEAVAVAVSKLNRCPYCVDAHAVLLRATSSHDAARAIQQGQKESIADPETRAYVAWATATRSPGSEELANPPFTRLQAPEVIGTAIWIHYINRMTKIFIGTNLIPLTKNPIGLRSLSERLGGLFFSNLVRKQVIPGASLRLLPAPPVSAEFGWAQPSSNVAQAFAGFGAAIDLAGAESLTQEVRSCVTEALGRWSGSDPGLGRDWMTPMLNSLKSQDRAAGRFALQAALAPDRIDENCIREFRGHDSGDGVLVGAAAWSSFAAARRISAWISG